MTQTVSIKDTRDNLASIIDQVAIGEDVFIITKFGKPRAMLVPINDSQTAMDDLNEVFGAWKNRKDIKNTEEWVRQVRAQVSLRKRNE